MKENRKTILLNLETSSKHLTCHRMPFWKHYSFTLIGFIFNHVHGNECRGLALGFTMTL